MIRSTVIFHEKDDVRRLLEAGKRTRMANLVALGAHAGCRRSEFHATDGAEIDWDMTDEKRGRIEFFGGHGP